MENDALLKEIRITHILDCVADPKKIRVIAECSDDVGEALPYLNAVMREASYTREASLMTFSRGGRLVSIYPHVITLAKASDAIDAKEVLEWLRTAINDAWARRESIEPCYERRAMPRILDVYLLLPKTNCGRCGQPTCMAFAAGLLTGDLAVGSCPLFLEDAFKRNGDILRELVPAGTIAAPTT